LDGETSWWTLCERTRARRELFATRLEIRTNVGVSFWLSVPFTSVPNTFPLLLFVYSYIPFPKLWGTLGAAWIHVFTKKKNKFLLSFYSSKLFSQTVSESTASLRVQNTRPLHSG
jgi:hypothetical protein